MESFVSSLLFQAPPSSYSYNSFPNELLWIPFSTRSKTHTPSGYIPAVLLPRSCARFLFIYFHTNGDDIGLAYSFGNRLRERLEVHVLLVEYPGYGICPGSCSEENIIAMALAAFRFVIDVLRWPEEDIIIMGRSLGAAVAVQVARIASACHGLVLVAPFLSLRDVARVHVGLLASMFLRDMFCNQRHICEVSVPTLIIHGRLDDVVPCSQGVALHELCKARKKFVSPTNMRHNSDLLADASFFINPMLRFFSLPDYAFVKLEVPLACFDKRSCPQYHGVVDAVKSDAPLVPLHGDQDDEPICTTTEGPQCSMSVFAEATGDLDDLLDWAEDTVLTPRAMRLFGETRGAPLVQALPLADATDSVLF